jgi:hypothetical protein
MTIPNLFDCHCEFGPYRTQVYRFVETAPELISVMRECLIERALVFHTSMRFDGPDVGNRKVLEGIDGHGELVATWTLLPGHTREMKSGEDFVATMGDAGIKAVWLFPNDHRYLLDDTTWRDQISIFSERKIPLFIKAAIDSISEFLKAFPELTVVTGTHGFNPLDRYAWPVVERFPNLHIETSCYLTDGAIEEFCQRYGSHRLLFGSGYPANSRGASVLRLLQADLSPEDREAVAAGNLVRLLEEADIS